MKENVTSECNHKFRFTFTAMERSKGSYSESYNYIRHDYFHCVFCLEERIVKKEAKEYYTPPIWYTK